jgi:hypothetical protein
MKLPEKKCYEITITQSYCKLRYNFDHIVPGLYQTYKIMENYCVRPINSTTGRDKQPRLDRWSKAVKGSMPDRRRRSTNKRRSQSESESEQNVICAVLHTVDYYCVKNPDASGAFHTRIDIEASLTSFPTRLIRVSWRCVGM